MNPPQSDVMKVDLHAISDEDDLGFIACMTIDRPDKLNALNDEVLASLKDVCDWMEATDDVRVLVVTGASPNPPPGRKAGQASRLRRRRRHHRVCWCGQRGHPGAIQGQRR